MMSLLYLKHKIVALMQKVKVQALPQCSLLCLTTSLCLTSLHLYLHRFYFYIKYWGKKTYNVGMRASRPTVFSFCYVLFGLTLKNVSVHLHYAHTQEYSENSFPLLYWHKLHLKKHGDALLFLYQESL